MPKQLAAFVVLCVGLGTGTGYAQDCLHGTTEGAEQLQRRREALAAMRTVNNIEANQPGSAKGVYLRHEELAGSPYASKMQQSANEAVRRISLNPGTDILPNWELTLDVTQHGYWFMIRDKADPCGFAFVSNQAGVIYHAEPIR